MSAVMRVQEPNAKYLVQALSAPAHSVELVATAPQGVTKIRELILLLAVRGKLVQQDVRDGSAESFLEHVRRQRDLHIAAGRFKRSSSTWEAEEEDEPFVPPKGWVWVRLGELGQIVGGGTPKTEDPTMWTPQTISWLTPADLYKLPTKHIVRGRRGISSIGLASSSAQLLPAGTVLFSSRAPIGYVAIAGGPLATNQGFKSCLPHVPELADYLYWFLKASAKAIDAAASGTTFKEISGGKFAQILVPLPPLAEQHRIVARVEELMKLCDALEARGRLADEQHARLTSTLFDALAASESAHALAENWQRIAEHFDLLLDRPEAIDALEQTILQLAVRGALVQQLPADETAAKALALIAEERQHLIERGLSKRQKESNPVLDAEAPFKLRKNWQWVRVADLCSLVTDGEHATPQRCDDRSAIPLVTAKNVRREYMDLGNTDFVDREVAQKCWSRCKPQLGDILMVSVGATLGRLCVLTENDEMVIVRSVTLLRPIGVGISADYLALHLMSSGSQSEIWSEVKQSAQPGLYLAKSAALKIALPPLVEQRRIVARVKELRQLCAQLRERLTSARRTQSQLAEALVAEVA